MLQKSNSQSFLNYSNKNEFDFTTFTSTNTMNRNTFYHEYHRPISREEDGRLDVTENHPLFFTPQPACSLEEEEDVSMLRPSPTKKLKLSPPPLFQSVSNNINHHHHRHSILFLDSAALFSPEDSSDTASVLSLPSLDPMDCQRVFRLTQKRRSNSADAAAAAAAAAVNWQPLLRRRTFSEPHMAEPQQQQQQQQRKRLGSQEEACSQDEEPPQLLVRQRAVSYDCHPRRRPMQQRHCAASDDDDDFAAQLDLFLD